MQSNSKIQVQAKTLDKAVEQASLQLGVAKDQINYEIISQANGGFLSFLGNKRIEIAAWTRAEGATANGLDRSQPTTPLPELTQQDIKSLIEDLKGFCAGICKFLVDSDVTILSRVDEQRLILDIDDDQMAAQLERNPKLAESMEHILRKKPRHLKRELPFRIFIDARGLRTARESELIEMAKDLSLQVQENQKPIVLNYKSSYDRKIIHMALDKDEKVYTKSIGSGANRKLMILPSKELAQ